MSKHKRKADTVVRRTVIDTTPTSLLTVYGDLPRRSDITIFVCEHWLAIVTAVFVLIFGLGVMAKSGWLPRTDPLSGNRTGWFGRELAKNAPSSWNPFGMPDPTPTPQLSKEYIYAGSRLLAVEDANANAVPPADLAVWRPSDGNWYVLSGSGWTTYHFGAGGDDPVEGDYDGDGKTDFAVFRKSDNNWYIVRSSDNTSCVVPFGVSSSGDIPAVADFDGDGKTDIAMWRPSAGDCAWYILPSSTGTMYAFAFGTQYDIPVPRDFDGDGRADAAVWRNSEHAFYSKNSSNAQVVGVPIGYTNDTPVPADYDGDGKANYAVKHGADWIILNAALSSATTTQWQTSAGVAVPNDYDGDGIVDIAVWKAPNGPGIGYYWYIRQSHDLSTRIVQWGMAGDIPVPANYRR